MATALVEQNQNAASKTRREILFGEQNVLVYSAMRGTVGEKVLREIAQPSSILNNHREFGEWRDSECSGTIKRDYDGEQFEVVLKLDVTEGVHLAEKTGREWSNKPTNLSTCSPNGVGPYILEVGAKIEQTKKGDERPSIIRTIANQVVATWTLRGFGWTTVQPEPTQWDEKNNNVEVFCPWAYGFDKGRKYRESSSGHRLTQKQIGVWQTTLSDEVVTITSAQAAGLEQLLADYLKIVRNQYADSYGPIFSNLQWGAPSVVVRFDMSPFTATDAGEIAHHVYEVEGNTAGLGFDTMLRLETCERIAATLKEAGIDHIGSFVTACRVKQIDEHELMLTELERHGIEVTRTALGETHELPANIPIWGRTGEEDARTFGHLQNRSLILFRDGGGHKRYLVERFGAEYLNGLSFSKTQQIADRFPDGFVVKPWRSWGTHDVTIWCPHAPYKRKCNWKQIDKAVSQVLASPEAQAAHIVQPFSQPTFEDGWYRIWRIFGVWDGERYRVTDGLWNDRRSLLVHGANDARFGAIKVM